MSQTTWGLLAVGVAGALVYGLAFLQRPPSLWRTLSKLLLATCLSLAARFADAPGFLALGLALCAVGDALLSRDPGKWLTPGIVVFLLAHLILTAFFIEIGDPHRLIAELWRTSLAAIALGVCAGLLVLLWPKLGAMRAPATAYALALLATVLAALTLPLDFAWAILGAWLFLASDCILSVRLFRFENTPSRLWDHLVWWLYAGAIFTIAWAFLHG